MGLRVVEGLRVADIEELGFQLDSRRLADLSALGLLVGADGRIALTPRGRLAADRIAAEISP